MPPQPLNVIMILNPKETEDLPFGGKRTFFFFFFFPAKFKKQMRSPSTASTRDIFAGQSNAAPLSPNFMPNHIQEK